MKLSERLALIRQAFRPTATTETVTVNATNGHPASGEEVLIQALTAASMIPPGYRAEIVHPRAGRDQPDAFLPWSDWRTSMGQLAEPGWSPCRFGARIGFDEVSFVYGIVRGDFGIWLCPFSVCDFNNDETQQEQCVLAAMTYLPTGMGLGVFADRATAIEACTITETRVDPARWAGLPQHDLDPNDKQQALTWRAHIDWIGQSWRFHGIAPHPDRHAHQGANSGELAIWTKDAANLTAGKPEKTS